MWRLLLIRILCAPVDVLAFASVWLLTRGAKARWVWAPEVAMVWPHKDSWLARRWRYSTTFGHIILMHPLHNETTLRHELVHVEQMHQACCLWWAVTALSLSPTLLMLSPFAWALFYAASCLAAWLGHLMPYRDNVLERHARHETEPQP